MHSSVLFLKDIIIDHGMYSEKAHSFEDHLLWNTIKEKGKFRLLKECLVDYRINPSSVTVDFKDYDQSFMEVKQKALKTGIITTEEEQVLLTFLKKLDSKKKNISYHKLLAKKYLWNNYNPKKSREHIRKAFKLEPLDPMSITLFMTSFLPQSVIKRLYEKSRK